MTPDEAATLLESTFKLNWANATPVVWDNTVPPSPPTVWARFTVRHGASRLRSWTGKTKIYTRAGYAFLQLYIPLGEGLKQGRTLAQAARRIFEGKSFSGGLDCLTTDVEEVGNVADGDFQINVSISFRYDEAVPG